MDKYLIVGLGNPGEKYYNTRHNIGFRILDYLSASLESKFTIERLAEKCSIRYKGRQFVLLKPTTFMNLSGKAVNYWMQKEKIKIENILIIADDIHLDFGLFRLKNKGSHGGHNGLKHIQEVLQTSHYPRFKFGIGNDFAKGKQADYVLNKWSNEERSKLIERLPKASEAILQFGIAGIQNTMNNYNGK